MLTAIRTPRRPLVVLPAITMISLMIANSNIAMKRSFGKLRFRREMFIACLYRTLDEGGLTEPWMDDKARNPLAVVAIGRRISMSSSHRNRWQGGVGRSTDEGGKTSSSLPVPGCPSVRGGNAPLSHHRTFFCTHSSSSCAISRLFRSSITMWPLPRMPRSCRGMYSVLTPAWLRYFAVQWSNTWW